jgi:hypothetical protein
MVGSASLVALAIPGGAASATSPLTVTCTKLTGSNTTQKFSGCSGSGKSETGTTGTSTVAKNDKSASVKWATGKTSTETFTFKKVTPSTCPKLAGETLIEEVSETGTITGGTATGLKGGKVSGKDCVYTKSGKITVNSLGSQIQ